MLQPAVILAVLVAAGAAFALSHSKARAERRAVMARLDDDPIATSGSPLADVFREAGVPPPNDPTLDAWPAPGAFATNRTAPERANEIVAATPPPLTASSGALSRPTADTSAAGETSHGVRELVAELDLPSTLEPLHVAHDQRPDVAWFAVTADASTLAPNLDRAIRAASCEIDWTGPTTATIRSGSRLATIELMTPDVAATHPEIAAFVGARPAVRFTALR